METKKATAKKQTKKAKSTKQKKVFIVQYELLDEGDPIREFSTLEAAKKFVVEELYNEGDGDTDAYNIDKSSIKVYEAILIGKPKIEILFNK